MAQIAVGEVVGVVLQTWVGTMLSKELADLLLQTLADREAGLAWPFIKCERVVALHGVRLVVPSML